MFNTVEPGHLRESSLFPHTDTELKERINNAPDELNIENVENHDGPLIQMV